MATLMKSTQPHWLGNKFVPVGTVLPEGHSEAIPAFYEPYEVEDPAPTRNALQDRARELGIKRVGNKSDDRLAEEIAAVTAGPATGDPTEPSEIVDEEPEPVEEPATDDHTTEDQDDDEDAATEVE